MPRSPGAFHVVAPPPVGVQPTSPGSGVVGPAAWKKAVPEPIPIAEVMSPSVEA